MAAVKPVRSKQAGEPGGRILDSPGPSADSGRHGASPKLAVAAPPLALELVEPAGPIVLRRQLPLSAGARETVLGEVLSPSQVRTYLDCSARWWFKYGLGLPEPKTSSLALGLAIHRALEINFREKFETGADLEPFGVVALFRDEWLNQMAQTVFRPDEDRISIRRLGEQMVFKYMTEAAATIRPAAVERDVSGEIGGIKIRGRIDLLESSGRIVDLKTAARRPAGVAPDYAFQLATYRQITPGASGEARLDTLVRTRLVQLVTYSYTVGDQDLRATRSLYPLVQDGIRTGLYFPNRQSMLCSRRNCAFWQHCEREFGGSVKD